MFTSCIRPCTPSFSLACSTDKYLVGLMNKLTHLGLLQAVGKDSTWPAVATELLGEAGRQETAQQALSAVYADRLQGYEAASRYRAPQRSSLCAMCAVADICVHVQLGCWQAHKQQGGRQPGCRGAPSRRQPHEQTC